MENKFKLTGIYNYWDKLGIWKKYAERNKIPQDCEKCKKPHIHKTVLLENGEHICWYCWIKKGSTYATVVAKPEHTVHKAPKKVEAKKPVITVKQTNPTSSRVINEGDVLENVLGEVDLMHTDTSHINEITKLANSVFLDDMIEQEIVDVVEDDEPIKVIPIVKKVGKPKQKTEAKPKAPVKAKKVETKKVETKKVEAKKVETKKVQAKKVETKKAVNKPVNKNIYDTKTTGKILNVNEPVINTPIKDNVAKKIDYSKYNPLIKSLNFEKSKKTRLVWTIAKYSILLITMAFAILALYYSTIWQSTGDNGFLVNIGLIKNGIFNFSNVSVNGLDTSLVSELTDKTNITALNLLAPGLASLGISDLTNFSNAMLYTMIVFSVLGLVTSISVIFFKDGTVWSLSLMLLSLSFVTITIVLWTLGFIDASAFSTPFNSINSLFSGWSTDANANNAIELKINDELSKLINLIAK